MTGWHAILFALETEVIISLLASGLSGTRVIRLGGKSCWMTFRKYGFLFPALSPSGVVPRAAQDPFIPLVDTIA